MKTRKRVSEKKNNFLALFPNCTFLTTPLMKNRREEEKKRLNEHTRGGRETSKT